MLFFERQALKSRFVLIFLFNEQSHKTHFLKLVDRHFRGKILLQLSAATPYGTQTINFFKWLILSGLIFN